MNINFAIKKYGGYGLVFFITTFASGLLNKLFEPLYPRIIDGADLPNKIVWILNLLSVKIPLYSFFFGVIAVWITYKVYAMFNLSRSDLKIIKATYGTDTKKIDITNELNNAIVDNKLSILINNNIAGDPHRHQLKKAIVKYTYNGGEGDIKREEYKVLYLPPENGQNSN